MYSLGLKQYPSLDDIVRIAASGDVKLRMKGLRYLLDNFTSRYSNYTPSIYGDIPFIPATRDSKHLLAKPSEVGLFDKWLIYISHYHEQVFAAPEWATLGFVIVDQDLREEAVTKLKIDLHPPPSRLVSLLEKSPPRTNVARAWFEILANRIGGSLNSAIHLSRHADCSPISQIFLGWS